jgi:hypothetical protein
MSVDPLLREIESLRLELAELEARVAQMTPAGREQPAEAEARLRRAAAE